MPKPLTFKPSACFWAVIPASGTGSRFSTYQNKLLALLDEKPVIWHSVHAFLDHPWIEGVIVLASEQNLAGYKSYFDEHCRLTWGIGGVDRRESVWKGLNLLPKEVTHVVVHDAARPLISEGLINEVLLAACEEPYIGAIAAHPISDTLKKTASNPLFAIEQTVDRREIWGAQTPQVFLAEILKEAHQRIPLHEAITDDAQLIEMASLGKIKLCASTSMNLKITTEVDLRIAQALRIVGLK